MHRRTLLLSAGAAWLGLTWPAHARPQRVVWSAPQVVQAQQADAVRLIDIRSRAEWAESGLAKGAWPISLHERGFEGRLMAARTAAEGRPLALICATGGRSARLLAALHRAGLEGFIDVSEGMFGSKAGPGWIARGLPVIPMPTALAALPPDLR